MKAIIQRVSRAAVTINGEERRETGRGLCVLVAVAEEDSEKDAAWLAKKMLELRIFPNEAGKFDLSVMDIKGELLAVSQFTLFADCGRGRRPDFTGAAKPDKAVPLYDCFIKALSDSGLKLVTGEFAADMLVEIFNDGPVTIILDSRNNA